MRPLSLFVFNQGLRPNSYPDPHGIGKSQLASAKPDRKNVGTCKIQHQQFDSYFNNLFVSNFIF